MATIVNGTNHIEINDGDSSISIPKGSINEVKYKNGTILIFREGGAVISIDPDAITSPSWASPKALYDTIKGYL